MPLDELKKKFDKSQKSEMSTNLYIRNLNKVSAASDPLTDS